MPSRTIQASKPSARAIRPWPYSWTRIETKTQGTQRSMFGRPSRLDQPSTAETTQNIGWMRTGMPSNRKWRSNGVGAGATSIATPRPDFGRSGAMVEDYQWPPENATSATRRPTLEERGGELAAVGGGELGVLGQEAEDFEHGLAGGVAEIAGAALDEGEEPCQGLGMVAGGG